MRTGSVSASPFWAGVRALARLGRTDADRRSELREVAASVPTPTRADARIGDLLRAELVLPTVSAEGRDDVIETLAARLAACHREVDAARLVAALREREDQMTTALVDG